MKEKLELQMSKRGNVGTIITGVLLALVVLIIIVSMIGSTAPALFGNATVVNAPSWFNIIYPVLLGLALFLILMAVVMYVVKLVK